MNKCSKIILCNLLKQPICVLNSIQESTVELTQNLDDLWNLSFTIDKYVYSAGEKTIANGWNDLKDQMYLYLDQIGYFIINKTPSYENNGNQETKSVTAYSADYEFLKVDLRNFEVNTGTLTSAEFLADGNVFYGSGNGSPITLDEYYGMDEAIRPFIYAKEQIPLYNEANPQLSFIHLLLQKITGWTIGYIDPEIKNIYVQANVDSSPILSYLRGDFKKDNRILTTFDINHFTVNFTKIENYGEDTNIFWNYRNIINDIKIETNDSSLYTRFFVQGANGLSIESVNFGSDYIFNLDYFMSEPYLTNELIEKYRYWNSYRESRREEYIQLSKKYRILLSAVERIDNRVPLDPLTKEDGTYFNGMNLETLEAALESYEAQVQLLQEYADTRADSEKYTTNADGTTIYNPKHLNGEVDHAWYLNLLKTNGGYWSYYEYIEYIIPNVKIAIANVGIPSDNDNYRDYLTTFTTDWDLYGLSELKAKQKAYENQIESLSKYEKAYADLTAQEKALLTEGEESYLTRHQQYAKYKSNYEQCTDALAIREKEYQTAFDACQATDELRKSLVRDVDYTNERFGFTDEELTILNKLWMDTDYSNENFLNTDVAYTGEVITFDKSSDAETKDLIPVDDYEQDYSVDWAYGLFQEAVKQLYMEAQPQYTHTCSNEDIESIPEYAGMLPLVKVGNFIRLGITNDFYTKLRIVSITNNPYLTDDTSFSITFSNMVKGIQGVDDYIQLLENGTSSGKNSITGISNGNNSEANITVNTALLQAILNNSAFTSTVNGIAANVVNASTANIGSLNADYLKVLLANIDTAQIGQATIDELYAKYINSNVVTADEITAKLANLDEANINTLFAENAFTQQLNALSSNVITSIVGTEYVKELIANNISVADLKAGDITLSEHMRILSENGQLIMDGSALQIMGKDTEGKDYIGIQLGYDTTGTPGLILRNSNGALLLTPNGITEHAIADGLIVNQMLGEKEISKDKLDFSIIEPNAYGGIDITNIYDGEGNQFGAEYISLKESVNSTISTVSSVVDANTNTIKNEALQITYTDKNGEKQTDTIQAVMSDVIQNAEQITSTVSKNTSDLAALNLGARNRILFSNDYNKPVWQSNGWTTADETYNGYPIAECDVSTADADSAYSLSQAVNNRIEENTEYTLSFWAKAAASTTNGLSFCITNANTNNLEYNGIVQASDLSCAFTIHGEWKKYIYSFKTGDFNRQEIPEQMMSFTAFQGNHIYISMPKLEKGNRASEYSLAPEDLISTQTLAAQTAEQFSWIVENGTNATEFTLTDHMIAAMTDKFVIKSPVSESAESIVIIEDGHIKSNAITSNMLATDAIKSLNYEAPSENMIFSNAGTYLNLANGEIISKNFAIDNNGDAHFKGEIIATGGKIGRWELTDNALYNGTASMTSTVNGMYLGTDGFRNYKDENTYVDITNGVITAKNANLTGNITATGGMIGTASIKNNVVYIPNLDAYDEVVYSSIEQETVLDNCIITSNYKMENATDWEGKNITDEDGNILQYLTGNILNLKHGYLQLGDVKIDHRGINNTIIYNKESPHGSDYGKYYWYYNGEETKFYDVRKRSNRGSMSCSHADNTIRNLVGESDSINDDSFDEATLKTLAKSRSGIEYSTDGTHRFIGNAEFNSTVAIGDKLYMGYNNGEYNDSAKIIMFGNSGNGTNTHSCRIYGGEAASTTGIGVYDDKNNAGVWIYNDVNSSLTIPPAAILQSTLSVSGAVNITGTLTGKGDGASLRIGSHIYPAVNKDDTFWLGHSSYRWKRIYGTTLYNGSGSAVSSDRSKKHSIEDIDNRYLSLFDALEIKRFKYNDGTSDRYHLGCIAQDVEKSVSDAGLSDKDFAAVICDAETDGSYYLRYDEINMLTALKVKELTKQIQILEARLDAFLTEKEM